MPTRVAVTLSGAVLIVWGAACDPGERPPQPLPKKVLNEIALRGAKTPQEIARLAMPSVVVLTTQDAQGQPMALGTGFFIADSIVATNAHVIRGATSATAKGLADDKVNRVSGVAAVDDAHDVALLIVASGAHRPSLQLGDSTAIEIGAGVFTLGNPEGLEGTFSSGMVSGKRVFGGDTLLQVTAPISRGSSGGPVFDQNGNVVGIATAAFRQGQNLNFAVPASRIAAVLRSRGKLISLSSLAGKAKPVTVSAVGQGAAAVVGEHFEWSMEYDIDGAFTVGLRNKSIDPISGIRCLIVFYDDAGRVVQSDEVRFYGTIAPGLAERVSGKVDPSVKRLTTPLVSYLQYARHPNTRLEMRILNYEIEK